MIFITADFIEKKSLLWTNQLKYMISRTATPTLAVIFRDKSRTYKITSSEQKMTTDDDIRQRLEKCNMQEREKILKNISMQTGLTLNHNLLHDTDFSPRVH